MEQITYTIKDPDGVHARPAGALIQCAGKCKSDITLHANGKSIKLKGGIFALMGLGIRTGTPITLDIEGEDEKEASGLLLKCLEDNL